jgi:2-iminobutanoate/2-iminopropanoate deaminase
MLSAHSGPTPCRATALAGALARSLVGALAAAGIAACAARPTVHHEARGALGPYSALVEAGDFVHVAGRIGATDGDFETEARTAIGAVEVELARAGLALGDVVQATCYLTDMGLYARFNAVYAERVPRPWPARAVVGVSALPAGARVEIVVVARRR